MNPPIIKILTALALSMATTHAVIYSGSLSSTGAGADGSLTGTEEWAENALFSWSASDQEEGCNGWYYTYTLKVAGKDISHVTTEVSSNFTLDNLIGNIDDPGSILTGGSLDLYGPGINGSSDPGIPDDIYGIKVDTQGDTKEITWSLCSDRVPVWGDMYAKDGKTGGDSVYLFNAGFTDPDTDPDPEINPAGNGSFEDHILVPDSIPDDPGPNVPEPSTGMLGAIGLMLILRRRNR
jgi:hypothetical protein